MGVNWSWQDENADAPTQAFNTTVRGDGGPSTREEERDSASKVGGGGGSLRQQGREESAASREVCRRGQWRSPALVVATKRAREARDASRRQDLVGTMVYVVRSVRLWPKF